MLLKRLALTCGLAAAGGLLAGCIATAVAGAAVGAAGTAVGVTAKGVGMAARGVGSAVGAVAGGKQDGGQGR